MAETKTSISFTELLGGTFSEYKGNFRKIVKALFLYYFIPYMVAFISYTSATGILIKSSSFGSGAGIGESNASLIFLLSFLHIIFNIIISCFTFIHIVRIVSLKHKNHAGLFNSSLRYLPKILLLSFFLTFFFIEIIVIAAVVIGFLSMIATSLGNTLYLISLVGVSILFLIVLCSLAVRLSFSQYFLICEDKGVFASIKESVHLAKGNEWRLFFYYLLFFFIYFIMAFGIGIVISVPFFLIYFRYMMMQTEAPYLLKVFSNALIQICTMLLMPLIYIFIYLLYKSLKQNKAGAV